MGATTSAKRGEARRAPSPPSHIQREVIGVILIALSSAHALEPSVVCAWRGEDGGDGVPDARSASQSHRFIRRVVGRWRSFMVSVERPISFPVLLGRLGFRCFSQAPVSLRLRTAASSLAAVFFLSAFLHLETTGVPTLTSGMISRGMAGGVVGQTIAEGLRAVFAGTGAHILIITGFLVSLLLTTPLSLAEAVRRMPERWATLREGVSAVMPERSIEVQKEVGNRRLRAKSSRPDGHHPGRGVGC